MATGTSSRPAAKPDRNDGTIVSLPAKVSSSHAASSTPSTAVNPIVSSQTSDPNSILDTIDTFTSTKPPPLNSNNNNAVTEQDSKFDPVQFLNHHFQTEASLLAALPGLNSTIETRLETLQDSISQTIQKQSDTADLTAQDLIRAKASIVQLHHRITLVQNKARLSNRAVLEITRDMKRLDYAKKHLSRTITSLKRLHMLLHAVTQLHTASQREPYPDYGTAAHLLDATRLLLGHFEGYMPSVAKTREVRDRVEKIRVGLRRGIVFGFRVVGFGLKYTLENPEWKTEDSLLSTLPMPPQVLSDACLVVDALGETACKEFISTFCLDHLEQYNQLFDPKNNVIPVVSNTSPSRPSFKIKIPTHSSAISDQSEHGNKNAGENTSNQASLDQVEKRYAWYRHMLRELDDKFHGGVFPKHWNVHYKLTHMFLSRTGDHFLVLFSAGACRDRDCKNVTVLLKALQKSILFEKEMAAWLQRDYGTVFLEAAKSDWNKSDRKSNGIIHDEGIKERDGGLSLVAVANENEVLEFDAAGKAVAAKSAEGIRINYARQIKERKKGKLGSGTTAGADGTDSVPSQHSRENVVPVPVAPLIGVASSAFDNHMGPYIALEEQNMDEQLVSSTSDLAVDTRGALPVFTSSTGLFVYIKNSITRCTALTRGKTFYSLYQAFQDTLQKYSQVLAGKFPPVLTNPAAAIAGISIGGVSAANLASSTFGSSGGSTIAVYRIPPGEETTICYAIDTCEYCVDTVEALQDLIRDKIEDDYKEKIDMSGEQEAFHNVTAKGLRILVSGLEQRTESALKEMTNINWGALDVVGEESKYVRSMHDAIQPFTITVRGLLPSSYFRNFCDKFVSGFTVSFHNAILRQKRISESGTQQLLLDVYNLKTLLLKLPVLEKKGSGGGKIIVNPSSAGSTIAPAMYTRIVNKQFARIEMLLKLVGTPPELLIDVFKVQWEGGSALDLQTVMNLKGMKRNEQAAMLERFGMDPAMAMKGATAGASSSTMTEHVQALHDRSSDVAAKVNSDLSQMRQKVEDFRKAFR